MTVGDLNFNVGPFVTLSPDAGHVGSTVEIMGSGYAPNVAFQITYDDKDITPADSATDATGSFDGTITIPVSKAGAHVIRVVDAQRNSARATFAMDSVPPPVPGLISPDDSARIGLLGASRPP